MLVIDMIRGWILIELLILIYRFYSKIEQI